MIRTRALLLFIVFVLWACDTPHVADSTSLSVGVSSDAVTLPGSGARLIRGHGSKGPLINSTVRLFAVDAAGYPADEMARTTTDTRGNWALTTDIDRDLLVVISGGRYVDEADPNTVARRVIELADSDHLVSVLPAGESAVAVTVFSDALVEKSRRETTNGNFLQVLDVNRTRFAAALGFDVLSVLPPDPLAPAGGAEQYSYALAIGGVANAINSLAISMQTPQPDFRHIRWISRDLVDCRLDGRGTGFRTIMPAGVAAAEQASVNAQILRFRNNNFARYLGQLVPKVDDVTCAMIGGSIDSSAPRITQVADLAPLAASSAAGVTVDQALRDTALSGFTATDDRVGELKWEIGLPAQLELGQNALTATVTDEWGNTSGAVWQITVADTEAPVVGTPDPIIVAAQGDRTSVILTAPTVTDNVSEPNAITLANDAPADGFPVGETVVTWSATDEAGQVTIVTQLVRVNSLPPVLGVVPANITWTGEGVDFSVFFSDPDMTTLSYSIAGLPPASALQFDTTNGLLSGVPGMVDFASQPLALTVFATDGQNTVSLQTDLEILAPNTPPVFTLSPDTVAVDEDFGELSIATVAAPVPSSEQGQTVTYSVSMVSPAPAPVEFAIDSATGQLTLVAIPDAYGEMVLRVLANDGQSTDATWSQDISITVAAVNDAPQVVSVPMVPALITGVPVSVNLAAAFSDIDDAVLTFTAAQLPASLGLSIDGLLTGVPQPVDAVAGGLPVIVTAVDASNAAALLELVLIVLDPDTDGDGLSDYQETLSGLNPQSNDSDADSYADSLETVVNIAATDRVLFVRPDGDDDATGTTPATALATLNELATRIAAAPPSERVIGLVEAAITPYTGNLSIGPAESERVIIGSVNFEDGIIALHTGEVPQTTLRAESRRIMQVQDCQSCALHHLRFADSAGALRVSNSSVLLNKVHIVNQNVSDNGAALSLNGGDVVIENSHIAANVSAGRGGAIYASAAATGQTPQVLIRDSIITGNYAFDRGAVLAQNGGYAQLINTLITGNGAAQAPFAVLSRNATVTVTGSTLAYNFVAETASNLLYAVDRGSRLIPVDNVVVKNRNVLNVDAGITRGATDGGFNLVADGHAVFAGDIETPATADFIGSYVLGGSLVAGIDSASAAATLLEPGNRFSVWNSRLPDAGTADRGFHVSSPAVSQSDYSVVAVYRDAFGYRHDAYEVDLNILDAGKPLAAGHRVRVGTSAEPPLGQVSGPSLVGVDAAAKTIMAVDLGNGTFRVWLSNAHEPNSDTLIVLIDDQQEGIAVMPTCGGTACIAGQARTRRR